MGEGVGGQGSHIPWPETQPDGGQDTVRKAGRAQGPGHAPQEQQGCVGNIIEGTDLPAGPRELGIQAGKAGVKARGKNQVQPGQAGQVRGVYTTTWFSRC